MADAIAPKGKYELVAAKWRQIREAVGGVATDWVDFVRGDIVDLEAHDADRLLRAGAVKPTTKDQAKSAAANASDPAQALIDAHPEVAAVPAPGEGEAAPAPGK